MNKQQELKDRIYRHCPELRSRIPKDLPLPVKYDGMMYYWGSNGEMIADFDDGVKTGDGFRIRGWGRIQDEKSQDECAKYIEQAINAYSDIQLQHVLRAMNSDKNYHWAISSIGYFVKNGIQVDSDYRWDVDPLMHMYGLKKSFDQNITDNPELLDFLLEVIK